MTEWPHAPLVAAALARRRTAAELSLAQLGELIGTDRQVIAHLCSGHRLPSLARLYELAEALHSAPGDLVPSPPCPSVEWAEDYAEACTDRLAEPLRVSSPDHLVEAVLLRTLAGGAPTDAEVCAYVWRTRAQGETITGRAGNAPPIRPREWYSCDEGRITLSRGKRSVWLATWAGGEKLLSSSSLTSAREKIVERYPDGEWGYELALRDREAILQRWRAACPAVPATPLP